MAASIFISFASKDVKVAQTLCAALESRGLPCWISARDIQPGENFQVSIVQALRHAKIMVLVFTANSNTSEEMTKELALASQQRLIVIPLRVEDVTPSDAFTYEFATRQWIDVFADWESSIDQLCRRITRALEGPAPTEATVPAELVPDLPPEPQAERAAAPIKVAPLAVEPVRAEPVKAEPAKVEPVKAAAAKADPEKSAPEKVAPIETRASAPREKVADAASAQANTATAVEATPPRSGVNPLILIAAALAVVAGVGVVGPKLFHGKARPAVAVAAAPPAGLIPAANNGQAAAVAAPAIADVALTAPPVQAPKVKRRAAKRQADTDIPY